MDWERRVGPREQEDPDADKRGKVEVLLSAATPAELRRARIDALVKALGPVGMAHFLQQFDPGHGDYTADRDRILGNPTVDDLMDELEHRRRSPPGK